MPPLKALRTYLAKNHPGYRLRRKVTKVAGMDPAIEQFMRAQGLPTATRVWQVSVTLPTPEGHIEIVSGAHCRIGRLYEEILDVVQEHFA